MLFCLMVHHLFLHAVFPLKSKPPYVSQRYYNSKYSTMHQPAFFITFYMYSNKCCDPHLKNTINYVSTWFITLLFLFCIVPNLILSCNHEKREHWISKSRSDLGKISSKYHLPVQMSQNSFASPWDRYLIKWGFV